MKKNHIFEIVHLIIIFILSMAIVSYDSNLTVLNDDSEIGILSTFEIVVENSEKPTEEKSDVVIVKLPVFLVEDFFEEFTENGIISKKTEDSLVLYTYDKDKYIIKLNEIKNNCIDFFEKLSIDNSFIKKVEYNDVFNEISLIVDKDVYENGTNFTINLDIRTKSLIYQYFANMDIFAIRVDITVIDEQTDKIIGFSILSENTQNSDDEYEKLMEIYNWLVDDIWNKGFSKIFHYGQMSEGITDSDFNINTDLENFHDEMQKKVEYNEFILSIDNVQYAEIQIKWEILLSEIEKQYKICVNNPVIKNDTHYPLEVEKFRKLLDVFCDEIMVLR